MAAEQSQFSKLPKKQLVRIAEILVDEDFPQGSPYYGNNFDEHYKQLESIGRYFSISVVHEDVEFFSKFLEMNDDLLSKIFDPNGDRTLIDKLVIPVAQTYELLYTTWGSCTYDDYMGQKFDSYDMDWVEDSAKQQENNGSWNLYDGYHVRDTVYENFESSDHSFDEVRPVIENVKESLLDRLVLENTSEVVSSLDRQTLLKLKSIIDSRLRSL
jgi:hypothetical protein